MDDSRGGAVLTSTLPVLINTPPRITGGINLALNPIGFDTLESFSVNLLGSNGNDQDGDPLQIVWDFGDGTVGSGASVTHSYPLDEFPKSSLAANGSAVVTVTVAITGSWSRGPARRNGDEDGLDHTHQSIWKRGKRRRRHHHRQSVHEDVNQFQGFEERGAFQRRRRDWACYGDGGSAGRRVAAGANSGQHVLRVVLEAGHLRCHGDGFEWQLRAQDGAGDNQRNGGRRANERELVQIGSELHCRTIRV